MSKSVTVKAANVEVQESSPRVITHRIGARSDTMRSLMILAATVQGKMDAGLNEVSQGLLNIAKHFQDASTIKDTPNGDRNRDASTAFVTACMAEEAWVKSLEAGQIQRDKLPKCWTQAKSNIKAALEYGIRLEDYQSESALRKEKSRVAGLRSIDPLKDELKALTKDISDLPTGDAIKLIAEARAAVAAARQALKEVMPEVPVKQA